MDKRNNVRFRMVLFGRMIDVNLAVSVGAAVV